MFDLAIRNSHKYVGTCSDLDDWTSIGNYDVVSSQSRPLDDSDPCDPTEITLIVAVESDACDDEIKAALSSSLSSVGCHHEYDCCGCVSTFVESVEKQFVGHWKVIQHASRNY